MVNRRLQLLRVAFVISPFDVGQRLLFERPILCADGLSALECHVLHHVSNTGLPARIVHGSSVDVGVEGDDRRLMALDDDEVESVREGEFGDGFFEVT